MSRTTSHTTVYDRITSKIVAALEAGSVPWVRPWRSGLPFNAVSGREYHGVNVLATMAHQLDRGLTSNALLTFRQAKELGGNVRQGEHGCLVVYFERIQRRHSPVSPANSQRDEQEPETFLLIRGYTVFGLEQCDGLERLERKLAERATPSFAPVEEAERIIDSTGAVIQYAGDRAFYSPTVDSITLPPRHTFRSAEGFASTAFHELGHWTSAPCRLNRVLGSRFGDPQYAFEELIAELASAFLCARVGLEHVSEAAAYLDSWLRALRSDSRAIFTAARLAGEAADYIYPALESHPVEQADSELTAPATP